LTGNDYSPKGIFRASFAELFLDCLPGGSGQHRSLNTSLGNRRVQICRFRAENKSKSRTPRVLFIG
jgi:hypothetical protein